MSPTSGFRANLPVVAGVCAVGGGVVTKRRPSAERTVPSTQALLVSVWALAGARKGECEREPANGGEGGLTAPAGPGRRGGLPSKGRSGQLGQGQCNGATARCSLQTDRKLQFSASTGHDLVSPASSFSSRSRIVFIASS